MFRLLTCLLFMFCIANALVAQNKKLEVVGLENEKLNFRKFVKNKAEAELEGEKILQQVYAQSYLAASIDSIRVDSIQITIIVTKGEPFKWVNLSTGNIDEEVVSEIDIRSKLFLNKPFNSNQLISLFNRTIQYYENSGYPFASVRLDSFSISKQNELSASLHLEKNKFYKIDSILIMGNSRIQKNYLLHYLNLKEGIPYHEGNIQKISDRIQEIPFIDENKETQVQYFEEGVKIIVDLKKRNASRFDGVLGLLTNEDDGSIELTGDINLNLINSFNRGEQIGLNWRKLKGNSQDLNLKLNYPFFLNTQFGLDFNFKLYKKDTTFLELTSRIGINYNLRRGELLTVYYESKKSSLLSRNSLVDPISPQLPTLGDVSTNSFGLAYDLFRYDYRYNPTKGISIESFISVGLKSLQKISALEAENPNIYDDVKLKTNQYNGQIKVNYFIPIASRSTFLIGNQSGSFYSENMYQNELLRIGGLKVLRGFDEESINVSSYSIFTLEYRFLLERNSYLSIFSDGGFYENNVGGYLNDTPFGIGAGISFETKAGIFTFNYAVGKQFDNPIEFQAAKIHFGFINFF